jgi:hypothetical protein
MQKMIPEYAQHLLDGGYAFGNRFVSYHDELLVVENQDDYYPGRTTYYGTQLKAGCFVLDAEGYVCFTEVSPVIDENTRFSF